MFGEMLGPYSQRLMNWVHEEGFCDESTRDQNWVDFFMMILLAKQTRRIYIEPRMLLQHLQLRKPKLN